jgi:hypothetical protein
MRKCRAQVWMFLIALAGALLLGPLAAVAQEGAPPAEGAGEAPAESPSARRAREEREAAQAKEGEPKAEAKEEAKGEAKEEAKGEANPAGAQSGGKPAYDMRVKELEEKVNDLKEKIFRSKSRLVLLKETVLRGKIAGSKAELVHKNEMGNSFKLEQAIYSLDGNQIYNKRDQDGDLADKEEFELFNGAIVPGKHNVSVLLIYRGNGYGVFSYLQGYKFTIKSSYTFNAEEGRTTRLKIIGYEKGDFTTALEDRPDVRYELEFVSDEEKGKAVSEGGR